MVTIQAGGRTGGISDASCLALTDKKMACPEPLHFMYKKRRIIDEIIE